MRILITNDDGIEAAGLDVLEKISTDLTEDVWVVAPETDNSGASHSLTLAEPLRMRELDKRHYAVKGTPTDCVIMGVRFLLRQQSPDLVLSGINRGQNLADDRTRHLTTGDLDRRLDHRQGKTLDAEAVEGEVAPFRLEQPCRDMLMVAMLGQQGGKALLGHTEELLVLP